MLIRGQNILGYKHYPDDVVRLFCRKAAENGMDIFRIFDALNDFRNIEVCIDEVKKCGKHAQGCICYTTSPVHTIEKYVEMCKELENMGVDSIAIKDMAGICSPRKLMISSRLSRMPTSRYLSSSTHTTQQAWAL
jgi:Pyruvate/oxaloacetate carboxyltransferase